MNTGNSDKEGVFKFRGLGVAMITPFKEDNQIDYDALPKVIDHIISGGADYIVAMGTTAETPTLSASERKDLKEFVKNYCNGRIPLVLGFGGNCTSMLVEELKTTDLSGYSAILSVAPYYNKPTQKGLYLHFSALAKASPLPIILYNIPGRTGVNITPDTCLKLAREFDNIIAVKEASGNLKQIEEIIDNKPNDFAVLSGDDSLSYSLIKMGASGVISVAGNAYPDLFGEMVHLCLKRNFEEARKLDTRLSGLYEELFRDGNPAGIKSLMHSMGLIENVVRLPLVTVGEETENNLKEIMEELKL